MIATNVFRFVSVRPPGIGPRVDPTIIDPPPEGAMLQAQVGGWRTRITKALIEAISDGVAPEDARTRVGTKIVHSDMYYTRHPAWVALLGGWDRLKRLMDTSPRQSRSDFSTAVESAIRELLGDRVRSTNLAEWRGSTDYATLSEVIWTSYVGNVLAPSERPNDREEIVAAIRFLYLVENAVSSAEKFGQLAPLIASCRPAVPAELFDPPGNVSSADALPPDNEEDDSLVELDSRFQAMRKAKQRLDQLMFERLQTLRSAQSGSAEATDRPQLAEEIAIDGLKITRLGGDTITPSAPSKPWALSDDDVRNFGLPQALPGVSLPGTIPEVLATLDAAMASTLAEMSSRHQEVLLVRTGGGFEVVDRPPSPDARGHRVTSRTTDNPWTVGRSDE